MTTPSGGNDPRLFLLAIQTVNDAVNLRNSHITSCVNVMAGRTTKTTWKRYAGAAMKQSTTRPAKGGVGVRGRKPVPDAIKEAQGTLKKSRVNNSQAVFDVPEEFPKAPSTMNLYGKRLWRELGPQLKEAGLYSDGDYNALELLCMAYGDMVAARKALMKSGNIVLTDKGTVYQHPNVGIANTSWKQVKDMLTQFGLTPAERTRVKALSPKDKSHSLADSLFDQARKKVEGGANE